MSTGSPILSGSCNGKQGKASSYHSEYVDYLARSFETQTWAYEQASGWIYW
jgi:glucan 1,3-beta-glucosidase